MSIFKKLDKPFDKMKVINMTDICNYNNCLQLVFTSEHEVNLFDYNSKTLIDTIKF